MAESRPNQAGQTGMAVLIIVILFGMLFLGVGGMSWLRVRAVRAERAAVEDARRIAEQALYEEQIARAQDESALRTSEEARNLEKLQQDRAEPETAVTGHSAAEDASDGDP